jgi:hypothetical protein
MNKYQEVYALAVSLYDSGDLSHDQVNPILEALGEAKAMSDSFYLIQNLNTHITLRGPYATDKERESELEMCLIDPGTGYIILLDIQNGRLHAWLPSYQYKQELIDRINNLPD